MTEWQQRREKYRSKRYIKMTNAEVRKENNKPITDQETINRSKAIQKGTMITSCLQAYINNNDKLYNSFSDRIKEIVQTIYRNAVNDGNYNYMTMLIDRNDGRVKEVIDVTSHTKDLAPTQAEEEQLDDKFSNKLYQMKAIPQDAQIDPDEAEEVQGTNTLQH